MLPAVEAQQPSFIYKTAALMVGLNVSEERRSFSGLKERYLQAETEGENPPEQQCERSKNCRNKRAHEQFCLQQRMFAVCVDRLSISLLSMVYT